MRCIHALALCGLLILLPAAVARAQQGPDYIDITGYLQTDAQYEAWFNLTRGLRRGFDEICGDTFCEGEYSNIQSLRYLCSVHRVSGRIGMCSWTFAASHEEIAPTNGRIGVERAFWQCRTPLPSGTTIEQLLAALGDEDEPLYAPLPGTQRTMMDGLIDCL
ncbi:hypothetical protein FZO89_13515 [Luteimonas viscosa]|uniref:Secreted protein n=1 Tax=Luteimonas viscosa TaxID=1132694 RepID=A0A5D4XR78_9GAMM|nr:hypothetical protein [Luteimonas viscosa]TYT27197.1 hypothetical protein FZO89_13515 [Luteimonas viscosa]